MAEKIVSAYVDRIEGDIATLLIGDDGCSVDWPASELPADAAEGTVVRISMIVDVDATKSAADAIGDLIERLERGE